MSRPRLFKDTLLYSITNIATKMIGALLLPVLTRLLSADEYGAIDLIATGSILALELIILGTDFTVALYYHDETINRRSLAGTLLLLRLSLSGGVAILLALGAPYVAQWGFSDVSPQFTRTILIAACTLPASSILSFWLIWIRQAGRSISLLVITLIRVAATAFTTIALVSGSEDRLESYFWAIFAVDSVIASMITLFYWRGIGKPNRLVIRPLILKGIAFLPRSMYFIVMALITRQILLHSGSLEAVGQYAAANKISYIVWIGISASSQAWLAYSLSIASQPEAAGIYRRYLSDYVSWIGFCVVSLALFAADILRILTTPSYIIAAPVVGWQALSLMAVGSLVIVSTGLNIIKDTAVVGRTTLVTGIINIGLAVVLIPWIGLVGAAIAAAIDQGLAAFVLYYAAQRRYPLPFDAPVVLRWITLTICGVSIATILPISFTWLLFGLKMGLIALYAAALLLWGNTSIFRKVLQRVKFSRKNHQPS
jgi:enterobacterial common antigen flippase